MTKGIRFKASFRARHPKQSAQEIIQLFGLQPRFSHTVGDRRKTPKGEVLSGVYEKSYVSFPLEFDINDSVDEFLLKQLDSSYLKDESKVNEFISTGGQLEFFLGIFCESNGGIELDPNLMKKLSEKHVSLALDIYGSE